MLTGRDDRGSARWILADLAGREWCLALRDCLAVVAARDTVPVPRAPSAVLGLTVWQGALVIVLDASAILAGVPGDRGGVWVRLAAPWQHLAIAVPSTLRLSGDAAAASRGRRIEPRLLVDPVREAIAAPLADAQPAGTRPHPHG